MRTALIIGNVNEIPILEFRQFHETIGKLVGEKFRLVSFFGSPASGSDVSLNVVFINEENSFLQIMRTKRKLGESYPALSLEYPQFQSFERECYEQYGVHPTKHPWLKPIRYPSGSAPTEHYPFYRLEGKEVHEVGVGPIHAGVIEPGHFRFMCYGEKVHHLEIQLGYQHRGVEKLLLQREPHRLAPLVETISGDSSIAHTWAYCMAWEALSGMSALPVGMEIARGVALELERIAMHLSGLSGLCNDIAFLPGSSTYGRLRTAIINSSMRFCGSRFGRGWLRPGVNHCILDGGLLREVEKTILDFAADMKCMNELFVSSRTTQHRLRNIGTVTKEAAEELGFVGMVARSSGIPLDLRSFFPGGAYKKIPMEVITEKTGDCWARAMLRIREIDQSTRWLLSAIQMLQKEDLETSVENTPLAVGRKNSFALTLVEGWRGEIMHYMETNSEGGLAHYKVQDPSLRNWFAVAMATRTNAISDFPICNKSFDLSYCGHDL